MDLRQFECFLDVAETQHVTNSANRLHIAQPALTRSIKRLEEELGVRLLRRKGRNIELTEAGEFVRDRVKPAYGSFASLKEDVEAFRERQSNVVRINVSSASSLTIAGIAEFSTQHPDVELHVAQGASGGPCDIEVIMQRVPRRGKTSSGIVSEIGEIEDGSNEHPLRCPQGARRWVLTERIGVAVPVTFDLGESVSLGDLRNERFVCLAGSRQFRALCDELCREHSFVPNIAFELDNTMTVVKLIGLGQGIGFWPECSWGDPNEFGACYVDLEEEGFGRQIVVEAGSHVRPGSAADMLFDHLCRKFAGLTR